MTGGDFVRNVKQTIDLLRQVAEVAPRPETATTARAAADGLPARRRRRFERGQRLRGVMIRPGEEWSRPVAGAPDVEVDGDDAALARWVHASRAGNPRALRPELGVRTSRAPSACRVRPDGSVEVALDALDLGDGTLATNLAIAGTAPDRLSRFTRSVPVEVVVDGVACFSGPATTVVVAVGQFLRGADLVPRGHPGDGRAEVQVYAVAGRDRRRLRARLRRGRSRASPRDHATLRPSDRDQQRPAAGVGGRRRGPLARQPPAPSRSLPARYRLVL